MHLRLLVRERCIIHKWQALQRLLYFTPTLSASKPAHVVHCIISNPNVSQRWLFIFFFPVPSLFTFYKHYHLFHLQKKQQILYLSTLSCICICCVLLCQCYLSQFSHTIKGMIVRVRCDMEVVSEVN